MSADNTVTLFAPPPPPPVFMGYLVDRAASLLEAQWPCNRVDFLWWREGERHPYFARVCWAPAEQAPRVKVFETYTGNFVCQSLVGQWFEIDPACWVLDVAPDEVDRFEWEEGVHPTQIARHDRKAGRCPPPSRQRDPT